MKNSNIFVCVNLHLVLLYILIQRIPHIAWYCLLTFLTVAREDDGDSPNITVVSAARIEKDNIGFTAAGNFLLKCFIQLFFQLKVSHAQSINLMLFEIFFHICNLYIKHQPVILESFSFIFFQWMVHTVLNWHEFWLSVLFYCFFSGRGSIQPHLVDWKNAECLSATWYTQLSRYKQPQLLPSWWWSLPNSYKSDGYAERCKYTSWNFPFDLWRLMLFLWLVGKEILIQTSI